MIALWALAPLMAGIAGRMAGIAGRMAGIAGRMAGHHPLSHSAYKRDPTARLGSGKPQPSCAAGRSATGWGLGPFCRPNQCTKASRAGAR